MKIKRFCFWAKPLPLKVLLKKLDFVRQAVRELGSPERRGILPSTPGKPPYFFFDMASAILPLM